MENQNKIDSNLLNYKGLNVDVDSSLLGKENLIYMRNGSLYSVSDGMLFVQNEESNTKVLEISYPVIGHIKLQNNEWCIFSTDDINNEIGIFNEIDFSYKKLSNKKFWNFNRSNIITGKSKKNQDGTTSIYFADGRRNPDRVVNLSKIDDATNENTRLAKYLTPPEVSIKPNKGGVLPNGSYQACIQFSNNGQPFGNIYSLTLPVFIFNENSENGSLDVVVNCKEDDFENYDLIIIQTTKSTSTAKRIGNFSRNVTNIHVSNFNKAEYINVPISDLTVNNIPYIKSDQITGNDNILVKKGVETIPDPNYQLQAFQIKSEYVVAQAPENYYEYGNNVGHYRDEVYAYWIELLHVSGYFSSGFTIPGRESKNSDLVTITGDDVYETYSKECEDFKKIPAWLAYNTASKMIKVKEENTICDVKEIGYGEMGFYESTDTYPDNKIQFGEYANTNIRLHKFPDESIVPRYTVKDGKTYINILGIRFYNIPHPLKEDGTPDTDWIGYRIVRADRNNNKSIISRGMLTNVRGYDDIQGKEKKEVLYTNYPINDLREDSFISQTQTVYKNNSITNEKPLNKVFHDKFTYYSPACYIDRYGLGDELKIETEEIADVTGKFSEVYQHPKHKLLTNFSFWLAAAIGAIETILMFEGGNRKTTKSSVSGKGLLQSGLTTVKGDKVNSATINLAKLDTETEETPGGLEGLMGTSIKDLISSIGKGGSFITVAKKVIKLIGALALKGLTFTFYSIGYANQVIDVIWKFLGNTNYALQYNCHAIFNKQIQVKKGNKRRYVSKYQYLENGLQTINGKLYNNFGKHEAVYVELSRKIAKPKTQDNTRRTLSEFNLCDNIFNKVSSQGVAFYATSKRKVLNQYGKIDSISSFLLTHNHYFPMLPENDKTTYKTDIIFGGDCFINKFSVQTKHSFFTQNQSSLHVNDNEEFDYKLYRNIGFPKYWANFFKYNFSELISKNVSNYAEFSRTVSSRHCLDCKKADRTNVFRIDDAYFYLYNNGILEFYVESDYNLSYREKAKNFDTYFYSDKFSSLEEIFRSDRLKYKEEFNYDKSFSFKASQIFSKQQYITFDPNIHNKIFIYSKNKIAYSLPANEEQSYDNWLYFLTNNVYEFPSTEFGTLTSITKISGENLLFLFDKASPFVTTGKSKLELSNTTVTIGDGGIFAQEPEQIRYTEQAFGSSQSRFATVVTPYGVFYPCAKQGRLLRYSGELEETSRNGLYFWTKKYMPIKLLELFPDFKDYDNTIVGVGYIISVDAILDRIYLSKKDYYPKAEYIKDITYNKNENKFYYKDIKIELTDSVYFEDLSFTLSYSTSLNSFSSFHDWVPDWVIPIENNFVSIKGNSFWVHNRNKNSFCNFYGKQYPFEVIVLQNNNFSVQVLNSIEYVLECYKYLNGENKIHLLNENFSHIVVYNSEQSSGLLKLVDTPDNPYEELLYPKKTNNGFEILFSKTENKYRVNNFVDIVKDRMKEINLIDNHPNGYIRTINNSSIDVNKNLFEQKDIRHYLSNIWFIKKDPKDIKFIFKINHSKTVNSPT